MLILCRAISIEKLLFPMFPKNVFKEMRRLWSASYPTWLLIFLHTNVSQFLEDHFEGALRTGRLPAPIHCLVHVTCHVLNLSSQQHLARRHITRTAGSRKWPIPSGNLVTQPLVLLQEKFKMLFLMERPVVGRVSLTFPRQRSIDDVYIVLGG